jgi:hypothetical protein
MPNMLKHQAVFVHNYGMIVPTFFNARVMIAPAWSFALQAVSP